MTSKHAVCETCGSLNVSSDALARWSEPEQKWELSGLLDNEDCDDCGGETNVVYVAASPDNRICECQNCDWRGLESHLKEIKHFHERVAPGEACPAGECPICGAVAHIEEDETTTTTPTEVDATKALAQFIEDSWGMTFDDESEMNGGDVVEWMGELIPMARKILGKVQS